MSIQRKALPGTAEDGGATPPISTTAMQNGRGEMYFEVRCAAPRDFFSERWEDLPSEVREAVEQPWQVPCYGSGVPGYHCRNCVFESSGVEVHDWPDYWGKAEATMWMYRVRRLRSAKFSVRVYPEVSVGVDMEVYLPSGQASLQVGLSTEEARRFLELFNDIFERIVNERSQHEEMSAGISFEEE